MTLCLCVFVCVCMCVCVCIYLVIVYNIQTYKCHTYMTLYVYTWLLYVMFRMAVCDRLSLLEEHNQSHMFGNKG